MEKIYHLIFGKAGGNASKNARGVKVSLPKKWIDEMGLNRDNNEVKLTFKDNKIIIEKNEEHP